MYAIWLSKPNTKIFHTNIFTHYLKYIVFFHTAPSPPEEGKPLPRPELATENAGSYNEGNHHEKFVPSAHLCHLCFCQILWNKVLSVGSKTTEYVTAYIQYVPLHHPAPPLCITIPCHVCRHLQPSRLTSFLFSHNQSSVKFWSLFHLCHFLQCPLLCISTTASSHLFLVEAVKISCEPYLPPIDLSNLSASLGTGVLTSPKGEAPRSPISSSAPPAQRKTPRSQPQRPSRPFSTSETVIKSHITSTTKGNTVSHFWFFLPSR